MPKSVSWRWLRRKPDPVHPSSVDVCSISPWHREMIPERPALSSIHDVRSPQWRAAQASDSFAVLLRFPRRSEEECPAGQGNAQPQSTSTNDFSPPSGSTITPGCALMLPPSYPVAADVPKGHGPHGASVHPGRQAEHEKRPEVLTRTPRDAIIRRRFMSIHEPSSGPCPPLVRVQDDHRQAIEPGANGEKRHRLPVLPSLGQRRLLASICRPTSRGRTAPTLDPLSQQNTADPGTPGGRCAEVCSGRKGVEWGTTAGGVQAMIRSEPGSDAGSSRIGCRGLATEFGVSGIPGRRAGCKKGRGVPGGEVGKDESPAHWEMNVVRQACVPDSVDGLGASSDAHPVIVPYFNTVLPPAVIWYGTTQLDVGIGWYGSGETAPGPSRL